jgi:predicted RNA polymerase sigma factor
MPCQAAGWIVVAHRQWGRIGGYDDPGAWVRRVAANLAVSRVRRRLAEARALVRLAGRAREVHRSTALTRSGGPDTRALSGPHTRADDPV